LWYSREKGERKECKRIKYVFKKSKIKNRRGTSLMEKKEKKDKSKKKRKLPLMPGFSRGWGEICGKKTREAPN